MRLSFTGSRLGLTDAAFDALYRRLAEYRRYHKEVRGSHGGCIGGDRLFHEFLRELWGEAAFLTIHPASNVPPSLQDLSDADDLLAPAHSRDRNEAIVLAARHGVLVACPWAPEGAAESRRSGTWQTIRMARRLLGGCVLVLPDGSVISDRG